LLRTNSQLQELQVWFKPKDRACRCLQRLAWMKERESEADEAKAERERERMAMMLIDWHDFSVVRTIDFDESEDVHSLGRPVTKQVVIQMNKTGDVQGANASLTFVLISLCRSVRVHFPDNSATLLGRNGRYHTHV
jgi:hypothetical protein